VSNIALLNTFSFVISYLLFLIFLHFANIYLWVHGSFGEAGWGFLSTSNIRYISESLFPTPNTVHPQLRRDQLKLQPDLEYFYTGNSGFRG